MGTHVLYLAKTNLFNGRKGRQTESGRTLLSESETGKCPTGREGATWHDFQAGKHVHFLVFAFMWEGGVVSVFHICHLRGNRAIKLIQTGICAESSLFFSSSKI